MGGILSDMRSEILFYGDGISERICDDIPPQMNILNMVRKLLAFPALFLTLTVILSALK